MVAPEGWQGKMLSVPGRICVAPVQMTATHPAVHRWVKGFWVFPTENFLPIRFLHFKVIFILNIGHL